MQEFIKIPAIKRSPRKPIYGVGINDAWYATQPVINSNRVKCPTYRKWVNMLQRCYSEKFKGKHPTYEGCDVCAEWLTFSNFSKWFEDNYVEGYQLDKDIKIKGNKIYSPETCLLVPARINTLLLDCYTSRGAYPAGVSFHKRDRKYQSSVDIDGRQTHLGNFTSLEQARYAYVTAKNGEIKRKCGQYPEFAKYLINHLLQE